MAINYNFIAYCSKISPTNWIIGMKAIHGEVPLDVVIPDGHVPPDPDNPELVGVLTTEGLERESPDGFELYRYLRQLNPRKNDSFGYNEVVIRNIHGRIAALKVNEELRVQVTYNQRKEAYKVFSYQIKLIGIFSKSDVETPDNEASAIATPQTAKQDTLPLGQTDANNNSEQEVYRTTSTLEKLIAFTQNLQQELKETKRNLAETVKKVERFENEWHDFREMQDLVQEILDRLTRLEMLNSRIQYLEADRHQLHDLQQVLQKFLVALNQQILVILQKQEDHPPTQ